MGTFRAWNSIDTLRTRQSSKSVHYSFMYEPKQ